MTVRPADAPPPVNEDEARPPRDARGEPANDLATGFGSDLGQHLVGRASNCGRDHLGHRLVGFGRRRRQQPELLAIEDSAFVECLLRIQRSGIGAAQPVTLLGIEQIAAPFAQHLVDSRYQVLGHRDQRHPGGQRVVDFEVLAHQQRNPTQ